MKILMKEYNLKSFKEKDVYSWDEILDIIQDLESEKFRLEEELEDLKQDMEENYKKIPANEQYEVFDDDFI
jgi:Txe/YoeB family toxin of Txe-Axe toxin-antitoxin module